MAERGGEPMRELMAVQKRMNKLLESALARSDYETEPWGGAWTPAADVFETDRDFTVQLELPGLRLDQIDLRVDGGDLVVEGGRDRESERAGDRYHRIERSHGRFARRFRLPAGFDAQGVKAGYRDGVLEVVIPLTVDEGGRSVRVPIG